MATKTLKREVVVNLNDWETYELINEINRRNPDVVYGEVDIDNWTSQELIDVIEERESDIRIIELSDGLSEWEQSAFNALHKGDKDGALELLRSYLRDLTGRVLP